MRVGAAWCVAVTAATAVVCIHVSHAQTEPAPNGAITAEPLPGGADATATVPAAPPTRRPTRPPTIAADTPTATATSTETATVAPATPTATRVPTVTATIALPTASMTPTATPDLVARLSAAGAGGNLAWFALGGLLTLCAVWLGARVAGGRDRLERRRARRTQASAILLELRRLDAVLRRMVALDNPASFPSLDHPIIEAALRDLTMFAAPTAARIAQFHGALRGIEHEIADYRDNPLRWAGRLAELNQLIKVRAAAACRVVPELLKALEKEGGTPPPHLGGESAPAGGGDGGTRLPPPPFGEGEGDDWTL